MADESNKTSASSIEDLFRRFIETVASISSTASVKPESLVEAVPEFSGSDIGEDATKWCNLVETITEKLPAAQRLSLATHALAGQAKKWYREWEGNPRTWQKFREDLCSVFVTEDRLCERLTRAVTYTSDSAATYTEYARNKLKYYGQTQIAFKPCELISLVIGNVMDASVRQSLMNARYTTTADLLSGIGHFVKVPKKDVEREPGRDRVQERGEQVRDYKRRSSDRVMSGRPRDIPWKRCFRCDEVGHFERECPKKRKTTFDKPEQPADNQPAKKPISCDFCLKKGHEESQCWVKRRTKQNV
ncbi:uncharacterized protein LOC143264785 [Megachile rotundata]|uniref:uncharacterized protein LOC143264785 n=1 Tax=Megachile rotundata TaxID=143995 RepID=UPI003FD57886